LKQIVKADHYNHSGPVRYVMQETEKGKSAIVGLSVAYDEAPVPTHYYVADYYQIVRQGMDVLLIFGKLDHPDVAKLRNKLEIYFPAEIFVRQLWVSSRDFQKILEQYVATNHSQATAPSKVSAQTDKVQTLHSNNVLMVLNAGHCIMDFFYISAKDLWLKPLKNEPIGIEALVRVIASAPLLLGFLSECDKLAMELVEQLGIDLEDDHDLVESKQSR